MADKAARLGQTHLDLLRGRRPTLGPDEWEVNYAVGSISESPNKQLCSNACALIWAYEHRDIREVDQILLWFEWLATEPFMPRETLTGEEVYRSLTALPCLTAAGIAWLRQNPGAFDGACRLARAHVAWCLLGLGPVPGREVVDHHTENVKEPCVLVGKAKPKFPIRRVAQAGKRGWIRNRGAGPKRFLFLGHVVHSVFVYQALEWDIPRKVRKNCQTQVDTYSVACERFPRVRGWCFDVADRLILRRFADEPSRVNARALLPHLLPTSLPVAFWRYADGSVVSALLSSDNSSTDAMMLDACYASGEVRMTSCDDGLRAKVIPQVAYEETAAFACRAKNAGPNDPTMRIPKPSAELVHTIVSKDGRTVLVGDGEEGMTPPPPATPPTAEPPPVAPPCPWYLRLLGRC